MGDHDSYSDKSSETKAIASSVVAELLRLERLEYLEPLELVFRFPLV